MTRNFLSPAFFKLFYNRTGLLKPHVQTMSLQPAAPPVIGSSPSILKAGGGSNDFGDFIDDYVALFKAITSDDFTFTHCEFWSQPLPTDDPVFVFDHSLAVVGTDTAAHVTAEQLVITYRTSNGGLMRFYQMEGTAAVDIVAFPPFSTAYANLSNFLLGADNCITGRDNGYPSSVISLKTKTNDVLRRKLVTG